MNLDPERRQNTEAAWRNRAATARLEALIARGPKRALELLRSAVDQQVRPGGGQASQNDKGQNNGS